TLGQNVLLEGIERDAIDLGTLQALIECDGISGALCTRTQSLIGTARQPCADGTAHIAVRDVQDAADLFRTQHLLSAGRDGFVSVEISAGALRDARRTSMEARGLWLAIGRRTVLVGVR